MLRIVVLPSAIRSLLGMMRSLLLFPLALVRVNVSNARLRPPYAHPITIVNVRHPDVPGVAFRPHPGMRISPLSVPEIHTGGERL